MKQALLYQSTIEGGTDVERFTYLGQGRIGVVHGFPTKLTLIDLADGSSLFQIRDYDAYGGVVIPMADADALYVPVKTSSQKLTAFDPATGQERWAASMGNGRYAFMVPPVQTKTHVAAANAHADKLFVMSKKTGKITSHVKMPHELPDYRPNLRVWGDKLIAVAADTKNDQWCIDCYDPATKDCFVKTIYRFPENKEEHGKILLHAVLGDALYFFTAEGVFCKLDLLTGKLLEQHALPKITGGDGGGWSYTNYYLHEHEGKLCAIGRYHTDASHYFILRYNLASGAFSAVAMDEPEFGWFQFYRDGAYQLNKKGVTRWDIFGDGSSSDLRFEAWDAAIPIGTFKESSDTGDHWLIAEDKLIVITDDDEKDVCILRCWDMG